MIRFVENHLEESGGKHELIHFEDIAPEVDHEAPGPWHCGLCGESHEAPEASCCGCGGQRPSVLRFTAERCIREGKSYIRLRWEVQHCETLTLYPMGWQAPAEGDWELDTDEGSLFRLEASNPVGLRHATAPLTCAPPRIRRFESAESLIEIGRPVIFSWEAEHAAQLEILPDIGAVDPGVSFIEAYVSQPGEYTLRAINEAGVATARIRLGMADPEIYDFSASSLDIMLGEPITLFWEVGNAERVEILPNIGDVSDCRSLQILADRSQTLTLVAHNAAGAVERSLRLTLPPPRVLFFEGDSGISTEGEPITLSWQTENAYRVILEPGFTEVPACGSLRVKPRATFTTYRLSAIGYSGSDARSFEVTWFPMPADLPELFEEIELLLPPPQAVFPMEKSSAPQPFAPGASPESPSTPETAKPREAQIRRAQEIDLSEDLLSLERASLRSELKRAFRKIKKLLSHR